MWYRPARKAKMDKEARQAKPNIVVLEFLDNFAQKMGIKNFDLNELLI